MTQVRSTTINGTDIEYYYFRGKVADTSQYSETEVYGSSGGQGYGGPHHTAGRISSKTYNYKEIFLVNAAGEERAFKLMDWNIMARPGHELTIIWAIKKGQESGHYIKVINHTTHDSELAEPKDFIRGLLPSQKNQLGYLAVILAIGFLSIDLAVIIAVAATIMFMVKYNRLAKGILRSEMLQEISEAA